MPDQADPGLSGGMFYGSVRLSSKGQVVIPQRVREEFGLKAGDQLIVLGRPDQAGFALLKPEGFLKVQQELARVQAQLEAVSSAVAGSAPAGGPGSGGAPRE